MPETRGRGEPQQVGPRSPHQRAWAPRAAPGPDTRLPASADTEGSVGFLPPAGGLACCWLQARPVPAVAGIGGANQQWKDMLVRSLSVPLEKNLDFLLN